jgi:hypothetical protein
VPLGGLPPEMAGLAAGIDPAKFYGHHLGINVTPLNTTGEQLSMGTSSLFGLIDYSNQQVMPVNDSGYSFKVDTLRVLFENSAIKSFTSQIEVGLNKLFGEDATLRNSPTGQNSIVLNGVYQSHDGQGSYVFSETGDSIFDMKSSQVLDYVEILKAQFAASLPQPGGNSDNQTYSRFTFWGNISFKALANFDLFSFGADAQTNDPSASGAGLAFSNLGLAMTFDNSDPSKQTFTFDPGHLSLDLARSQARANSLYSHFPLKLTGFVYQTDSKSPTDLGYMPIDSPLGAGSVTSPWYGLTFDLNLGTVGALAAKVGFIASLVAAWNPGGGASSVFTGLKLPGSSGSGKEISIEGVLKLAFADLEFFVSGQSNYILKLDNMALKILSLSFPPYGQTAIYLFGDPDPNADNSTLGWYAAYAKNRQSNQNSQNQSQSNRLTR